MELSELDGRYKVTIASNVHDFFPGTYDFGEADLGIKNGEISGTDVEGCTFSGNLSTPSKINGFDIDAIVIVDPRTGPENAFVMHYDGQPKKEPVTHELPLRVQNLGNTIIFKGEIRIGPIEISFTGSSY